MSEYNSQIFKGFLKGLNAVVDRYNQPQGSVPRASNMLLGKRGSFLTCDGSQLIHAYNGVPTAGRGKIMAGKLFAPTGVSRYYLTVQKALDQPLGTPQNLTLADAGAQSPGLAAATYFYRVGAVDGAGGETNPSNEPSIAIAAGHGVTLTWNVTPNAAGYNIYRGTSLATAFRLVGILTLPVSQPVLGTLTVTFTDTGAAVNQLTVNVATATSNKAGTQISWVTTVPHNLANPTIGVPIGITAAGMTPASFNLQYTVTAITGPNSFITDIGDSGTAPSNTTATGGSITTNQIHPNIGDGTQQTALYQMPTIVGSQATLPVAYNNSNIAALYPADLNFVDGGGGGGTGGGGGGGGGGTGGGASGGGSPSGGIPGNVSFIPEMVQFSNRMAIALGNGYNPHLFSDPSTGINPAIIASISAIAVDAFGVVTITTSAAHGIVAAQAGGSIIIAGVTNTAYNSNGFGASAFVILNIPDTTHIKVVNLSAIGQGASSGGTITTTSLPIISTFVTAYPIWATMVTYLVNDIVQPSPANGHYYKATQGGISGGAQPTFPTVTNQQVAEASPSKVIWQEAGLTNASAPPPPGAAHLKVYAGSLWAWNTSPTNTSNGLDGPTALRMSDVNNPNSWNPINQAFIDKDDGTEGSGLSPFTISGFGIPPEGSLVAFKQISGYQIVGVFGSQNFLIQRIKSSLGNISPRSIEFATGYGLIRMTHLGLAVFDGMNDRIISEEVSPYLFPINDVDVSDITVADYNWLSIAWGTQTARPPMYTFFIPIGSSGGKLTRALCYDLVLKTWAGVVDLPFSISTAFQVFSNIATPTTLIGSFNDGGLHRWQSGDEDWDNSIDFGSKSPVHAFVESPLAYNTRSQGGRIFIRQIVIVGKLSDPDLDLDTAINVSLKLQGEAAVAVTGAQYTLGTDGSFTLNVPVMEKVTAADCVINITGSIELNSIDFHTKPEVATVPARIT